MSYLLHKKAAVSLSAAITAIIWGNSALAQTQTTNDKEITEQVIVVGRMTNTEVTPEELEKQQAIDLSDIFRYIPSVSVGGSLGVAQKVYVRGMEDTYLNVTVDGAPQTSTMFHHIGRVNIEPELLQQVEVQAGAGEATSGAGAIGGAIRFKTKSASDLLSEDSTFGGTAKATYASNSNSRKGVASLYGRLGDSWGILGSYVAVNSDDMVDGNGDDIKATGAEQRLGFIKADGGIGDHQHLSLSYENRDESGDYAQRPNWDPSQQTNFFPMDVQRETSVVNYSLSPNQALNLETTVYYTEQTLAQDTGPENWGTYSAKVESIGTDIRNTSRFGSNSLTYGVDYRQDKVTGTGDGKGLYPASKDSEEGTVMGAYIQDHWSITDALLLSAGVRYDNYDLDQKKAALEPGTDTKVSSDGFSPNIGLNFKANEYVTMNIGYAEAMRGKEVGDGFTLEGSIIAPNLEPEKVNNTELGIEYADENLFLSAAVYQSEITDVIMDQIGRGTYYENAGKFETQGLELAAAYQWDSLRVTANYSKEDPQFNGHDVEGYEEIGLANSRGDTWNLGASYILSEAWEFEYQFTYTQDITVNTLYRAKEIGWIDDIQQVEKPGYQVHDIFVRWKPLGDSLNVDLAVLNLFDEHYRDQSSVADYGSVPGWNMVKGLYEPGRDVRATVTYNF
ncbi:TonB-dependent receptor domain-containing protein [Agaribacterium sp. ZY112]|uniref:TonB-dependent receptor domain-containing protein n=1 Tax=Agaribacterium sp. ZY112 TaxID=3233574 RepID=UPI003526B8CD